MLRLIKRNIRNTTNFYIIDDAFLNPGDFQAEVSEYSVKRVLRDIIDTSFRIYSVPEFNHDLALSGPNPRDILKEGTAAVNRRTPYLMYLRDSSSLHRYFKNPVHTTVVLMNCAGKNPSMLDGDLNIVVDWKVNTVVTGSGVFDYTNLIRYQGPTKKVTDLTVTGGLMSVNGKPVTSYTGVLDADCGLRISVKNSRIEICSK